MNTATATSLDSAPISAEHRLPRRSREEVEALAKNFIATPAEGEPTSVGRRAGLALAAGGIALAALLGVLSWPESEPQVSRPAADTSRAAAEAEQWRARYEAERERKRKELQAGGDYLAKMAAAESAVLRDMGSRASRLTAEPEAAPEPVSARQAPANSEPTPRDAPAPRRTTPVASASSAPAPVASQPKPAAAKPEPVVVAEEKSTTAAPVTVAAAPQCKLHVSQLSSTGTLTFEAIKGMKGARVDGAGYVLTPPVTLDDGRRVSFRISPDGCVKWRGVS